VKYVYGCTTDVNHPRREVIHGMKEEPEITCESCGARMARVPQAFIWGHRPFDTLLDKLEERYRKNRYRRSLSK
jgi:hypothetical protein